MYFPFTLYEGDAEFFIKASQILMGGTRTTIERTRPSYNLSTGCIFIHSNGFVSLLRYRYGAKSTSAANVSNFKMAVVIILKKLVFSN